MDGKSINGGEREKIRDKDTGVGEGGRESREREIKRVMQSFFSFLSHPKEGEFCGTFPATRPFNPPSPTHPPPPLHQTPCLSRPLLQVGQSIGGEIAC